jgi:ribosomal protein S18 acetylase RimI-like enzyme
MTYLDVHEQDYALFHDLANDYYREGEDTNTPQDEIDAFIRLLFQKITHQEFCGCFAENNNTKIGFAIWTIDTEDFVFSELPGYGTILEIGVKPQYRGFGYGEELVHYVEQRLADQGITQCYISAYGPAQKFWSHMGYAENGVTASNGLPIMVKSIAGHNTITKTENGDLI